MIDDILLELNIAPHELNCLIVDYQKPEQGEFIANINSLDDPSYIATDKNFIYIVEKTCAIKIYDKNYLNLKDKWQIAPEKVQDLLSNCKYEVVGLVVDDECVYLSMNISVFGVDDNYNIVLAFDKSGKFIKQIGNSKQHATAISHDEKYVYIIDLNTDLHTYCKKTDDIIETLHIPVKNGFIVNFVISNDYIYMCFNDGNSNLYTWNTKRKSQNNYVMVFYSHNPAFDNCHTVIAKDELGLCYFYKKTVIIFTKKSEEGNNRMPGKYKLKNPNGENINYKCFSVDDEYLYFLNKTTKSVDIYKK